MEIEPIVISGEVEDPVLLGTARQYYAKELREKMAIGINKKYQECVQCRQIVAKDSTKKTVVPKVNVVWEKARTIEYGQKKIVEVPVRTSHRVVTLINIKRDSLSYTPDSTMFKTIFDHLLILVTKEKKSFRLK